MTEPDDPFPRDSEGKRFGGPFTWILHEKAEEAFAMGWRPLPLTHEYAHPVTNERAALCAWMGEGPMRLPT